MSLNQSGKTIKNYRKKLKNTKKHKIKKHIKTKKKYLDTTNLPEKLKYSIFIIKYLNILYERR